jgi:hypothetical protein
MNGGENAIQDWNAMAYKYKWGVQNMGIFKAFSTTFQA